MAFKAGTLYTNSISNQYGTDKGSVATNQQAASEPTFTWLCTSSSKVFAVFKSKSGRSGSVVHRLRVYRDKLGSFVFPRGRFSGAPIFRS